MQIGNLIRAKMVLVPFVKEKLSPKLSYKLMKFISKIETEERFFNEKVRDIINTYGERDENNELVSIDNRVKIMESAEADCNKAFSELDAVEVEVPSITFTLDELSEIKLSIEDMVALDAFIVEE